MATLKKTVVLFPSLGMGHLIPFVELAKLLINHHFQVTVIVVELPNPPPAVSSFVSTVSSAHPSIAFHRFPVTPPQPNLPNFRLLLQTNPQLSSFLSSLISRSPVSALILDMFCTSALDVATELSIPAYFYFASGASALAAFVSIPAAVSQITTADFKALGDTPFHFPGVPPIPASHLMLQLRDRDSDDCRDFLYHMEMLPKADGIMINSFESLESRAVGAMRKESIFPPIYCIGPLTADGNGESKAHECVEWLDAQPRGSVVFLCFGSRGAFSEEQLREIAVGLERSGQRFLWVVRNPPTDDPTMRLDAARPEPDLDELLPEGFLKRTEGRGMVVKSWAPQTAVLSHGSVGCFVTHCGWNSVLEAVSAGVPMIAWPLYAEQRMNKVFLVEEAKLAVELKGYDKELVSAEEVETKIKWLMESEGGKEMKRRVAAARESAVAARKIGGSSDKAWAELVSAIEGGQS